MNRSYKIKPIHATMRLDRWIKNNIGKYPQSLLEKSIRKGKIKLNRRELRKLISEAITAGPEGVHRVPPEDRSPRVPVGKLTKDRYHGTAPKPSLMPPQVKDMLDLDDPEYAEQAYELSDTLQNLPSGTTKSGVSDFEYAKTMSKLANTPLDQIVRDNIPAEFYVYDVEYREEQDLDGHVDKEYTVYLHNNEGTREIDISHEPPHPMYKNAGKNVIIRVHKLEHGKTWPNGRPMQQGMLDYKPVLFGLDYPDRFEKAMNIIVQRMK